MRPRSFLIGGSQNFFRSTRKSEAASRSDPEGWSPCQVAAYLSTVAFYWRNKGMHRQLWTESTYWRGLIWKSVLCHFARKSRCYQEVGCECPTRFGVPVTGMSSDQMRAWDWILTSYFNSDFKCSRKVFFVHRCVGSLLSGARSRYPISTAWLLYLCHLLLFIQVRKWSIPSGVDVLACLVLSCLHQILSISTWMLSYIWRALWLYTIVACVFPWQMFLFLSSWQFHVIGRFL